MSRLRAERRLGRIGEIGAPDESHGHRVVIVIPFENTVSLQPVLCPECRTHVRQMWIPEVNTAKA